MTAPFSCATASTLAMNSWCSRWALLTSAMVGWAMAASSAISPGWFMPSSSTAARCCSAVSWRRRSTCSGTPMWLLKLPAVASAASPNQACRMAATIWVTVVLPLLPATAISGRCRRLRQALASCCSATSASGTSRPGKPASRRPCSASAAAAPAALACGKKLWASKLSPRSATNKSPARRLRVSLCTRSSGVDASPTNTLPGSSAWAWARRISGVGLLMPGPATPAPQRRRWHPETAACGRPRLGCPHGLCRPPAPHRWPQHWPRRG